MYGFQSPNEPVVIRLKMKSKFRVKLHCFSMSSISNWTFGGALEELSMPKPTGVVSKDSRELLTTMVGSGLHQHRSPSQLSASFLVKRSDYDFTCGSGCSSAALFVRICFSNTSGYVPQSIAHITVPVPTSRTR